MIKRLVDFIQPRILDLRRDELLSKLPEGQREIIEFFLKNQKSGKILLGRHLNGKREYSNCYGTSIRCCGKPEIEKSVEKGFERENGYLDYFPGENGNPGYIDENVFVRLLEDFFGKVDPPSPGDIITLWPPYSRGRTFPVHAGIWTGVDNTFFEQRNIRGRFQFDIKDREKMLRLGIVFYQLK